MNFPYFHAPDSLSESELLAEVEREVRERILSFQEGKINLCLELAQMLETPSEIEGVTSNSERGYILANRLMSRAEVLMSLKVPELFALRKGYKP